MIYTIIMISTFTQQSTKTLDILEKSIVGLEFEFYSRVQFHKLIELLNKVLFPIKVHGFKQYHHPFVPTSTEFKVEPDLSGGENMVELVTGPLPYHEIRVVLVKVLTFMETYAFTTEKCSVHVNCSFLPESGKSISYLNPLKLIMKVDEEQIYRYFPSREKNIYAKSVKRILPPDGYIAMDGDVSHLAASIKLPDTKYFGINFSNIHKNRLEWRYIGGKDYHLKRNQIMELMDRFLLDSWDSIGTVLTELEQERLHRYLVDNRSRFHMIDSYDDFIANYHSINIQIDKNLEYETVRSYYPQIREKIYDIIVNTKSMRDCTLNWDTTNRRLEIVGATIDGVYDMNDVTWVDCTINEGIFSNCEFVSCQINNIDVALSRIWDSELKKSRLFKTDCNLNCELTNCFYNSGFFDGTMEGGIFRAGQLGKNAYLSSSTKKMVSGKKFFGESPIGHKKQFGTEKKFGGEIHVEIDELITPQL